jgi:hypothetical protein
MPKFFAIPDNSIEKGTFLVCRQPTGDLRRERRHRREIFELSASAMGRIIKNIKMGNMNITVNIVITG